MDSHDFRNVATRDSVLSFGWPPALLYACGWNARTLKRPDLLPVRMRGAAVLEAARSTGTATRRTPWRLIHANHAGGGCSPGPPTCRSLRFLTVAPTTRTRQQTGRFADLFQPSLLVEPSPTNSWLAFIPCARAYPCDRSARLKRLLNDPPLLLYCAITPIALYPSLVPKCPRLTFVDAMIVSTKAIIFTS